MAEREQIQPGRGERGDGEPTPPPVQAGASRSSDRLKDELDDLLDEIDEVLETNAEEFVKSYIQKGGE